MLVQWHEDFEMGHAGADGEHREVIELLNELDVCLTVGAPAIVIDRTLARLGEKVETHFRHEETEWCDISSAHRSEHGELLDRVHQLRENWRTGARILDHRTLMSLARWWLTHVRAHDAGEGVLIH